MSYSGITFLDSLPYVERRAQDADAAEARVDALAAQAARRHAAIEQAARRARAVGKLVGEGQLGRAAVIELLEEIARDLEKANKVRVTDEAPHE